MYCVLIDHPHEGVILWETGCGVDYATVWGHQVADLFARVRYEPRHELKAAVEATGHKLEDVKKMCAPPPNRSNLHDADAKTEFSVICIWTMLVV